MLRAVTDDVFFTPGVNRGAVFSLFTPNVRYIEVTEDGFSGEVVIPSRFTPDAEAWRRCAPTSPVRASSANWWRTT